MEFLTKKSVGRFYTPENTCLLSTTELFKLEAISSSYEGKNPPKRFDKSTKEYVPTTYTLVIYVITHLSVNKCCSMNCKRNL